MRGAALQGFTILHHCLDGIGVKCSGKTLRFRLHTLQHGHGHPFFCKFCIDMEHLLGFLFCLFTSGMCGMPLLPKEF